MKNTVITLVIASVCLGTLGAAASRTRTRPEARARDITLAAVDDFARSTQALANSAATPDAAERALLVARDAYKRVEAIVAFSFPGNADGINGPPIPRIEDGLASEVIQPEGLQLLEQLIVADRLTDTVRFRREAAILAVDARRLRSLVGTLSYSPSLVFSAARAEIMRIAVRGLANADSPVLRRGEHEARIALDGVVALVAPFGSLRPTDTVSLSSLAVLGRSLDSLRKALGVEPLVSGGAVWRQRAATLFDSGAFDPFAFAPAENREPPVARIELGRALFFDPMLSGDRRRSCATCHQPDHAFADARASSLAVDDRTPLARNAPSLINVALQPALFHDSRTAYLEDQAGQVIENPAEMHGNFDAIVRYLTGSKDYTRRFVESFPSAPRPIDRARVQLALAAYVRSLVALNAPLDHYLRGDSSAMSLQARRGLAVFTGKARCASCHALPLTSGAVPPEYLEMESEGLGVPSRDGKRLDSDAGLAARTRFAADSFHFRTPSLRNVTLTAPYMHSGSLQTLDDVIDFYNRGGGTGLGFAETHQTLSSDSLHLTRNERDELVAFLHALTDVPRFAGGSQTHLAGRSRR